MGNTSSERAALERQGGHKTPRRDSSGGSKDGDRPKILMDSPEDADIFHSEEIKAPEKEEFLAWQHDLEVNDKAPAQARPTVFRWTGGGKEVYLSGSFNNWSKLPLTRSQNNFVAILDLPEGEHQYKFFVDGQWTHDPSEPIVTSQLGTVNNIIQVKKTDFEVFDALMVDSQKCSDVSGAASWVPRETVKGVLRSVSNHLRMASIQFAEEFSIVTSVGLEVLPLGSLTVSSSDVIAVH
ncbi:5'-AMP-activated protein kinase subunit beta-1 isoform X3 [Meriones unguiculatus]|uniref:5'-AMP-activated protein kinase subunit beta-1 isoform X3 n=1 Tax=Meriones unguiculatus TaxID=10047 RepID=UPI000B4ED9EB|nr:5'-AMP-activated protein kinase subunit beta-1 isoform X3 [Meriones unguiculatus]